VDDWTTRRANLPDAAHHVAVIIHDFGGPWNQLRMLRADPPTAVRKLNDRRKTFAAGLEQGEQLWKAAESMAAEARPIVLFYGLSQVGRAIVAALHPNHTGWRYETSHGLTFELNAPAGRPIQLEDLMVTSQGHGLVQQVGEILDSPVIDQQVSLADLLGALVDDAQLFVGLKLPRHPINAPVERRGPVLGDQFTLVVTPVPPTVAPPTRSIGDGGRIVWTAAELTVGDAIDWLRPYGVIDRVGEPTSASLYVQPYADYEPPPEQMARVTSRSWLQDHLDAAVRLGLEHLISLRRLGERHLMGGQVQSAERVGAVLDER
jgi:hypothetical protein